MRRDSNYKFTSFFCISGYKIEGCEMNRRGRIFNVQRIGLMRVVILMGFIELTFRGLQFSYHSMHELAGASLQYHVLFPIDLEHLF